ncbi:MAG: MFS transporter, partial [Rickettsiales bacterium]
VGGFMGPIPATLVELFPTNIRFTGLALSYNFSAALFGGTAPFVYLKMIEITGSVMSPIFYILMFVCITLFALSRYKDTCKQELAED